MGLDHSALGEKITRITEDVFTTMLAMDLKHLSTTVESGDVGNSGGVAALIGFAGRWVGTGCISCSSTLACEIAGTMLMAPYDNVCDDVLDAAGEIANMVIGNIKNELEEIVGPLGLSIPTVVYGRNFATRSLSKNEWTSVAFDCAGQKLLVQVMLAENRTPPTSHHAFSLAHQVI